MGDAAVTQMPQNVPIRLNVGGTVFHTALHTLMVGAQCGSLLFQVLCAQILGPVDPSAAAAGAGAGNPWERRVVSAPVQKHRVEHFVDADPTPLPYWLEYLRTRKVPYVEAGPVRERLILDSERAGLTELAQALRGLTDYRRAELQAVLLRKNIVNLHGARLGGQDLSNLGFAGCSLRCADLSRCNLSGCDFAGANLSRANLSNADLTGCNLRGADLRGADLRGANLSGAVLPWDSGLMEGVQLAEATGWVPANKDMSKAKLQNANLSASDLKRVKLRAADLRAANLRGATLEGADLADADMDSADLTGAV